MRQLPWQRNLSQDSLNLFAIWFLVGLLKVEPRLVYRSLRVVIGLNSLAIFIYSAVSLPGNIEDLA